MNSDDFITVDLLRHGATEGGARYRGRTDIALTEAGWRQMEAAAEDAGPWRAVVSSPLLRCRAFATRLAAQRAIPCLLDERLVELDFGDWEGCTAAALMRSSPAALKRFWQDPLAHPPPGGEAIQALSRRVLEAWREIRGRREPLLVVSHGGPIRVILAHLAGRPLARLAEIAVPHAVLLPVHVGWRPANLESVST